MSKLSQPRSNFEKSLGPQERLTTLDQLRAVAVVMMIIFHFFYQLKAFQLWEDSFGDLFWFYFPRLIVSSFALVSGLSLSIYSMRGRPFYWKRVWKLLGASGLVSLVSWLVDPQQFVYFGIFHFFFLTSLLVWPLLRRPMMALILGMVIIVLPLTIPEEVVKWEAPPSMDYIPLVPWFGMMLIGVFLWRFKNIQKLMSGQLFHPRRQPGKTLCWMGQHSFGLYFLHHIVIYLICYVLSLMVV